MIELIISDMMCGKCASRISAAVSAVDPAGRADIDIDGRWIRIATRHPAAPFVSAIHGLGFTPVVWWDGTH